MNPSASQNWDAQAKANNVMMKINAKSASQSTDN